jgi:hypothetical protein
MDGPVASGLSGDSMAENDLFLEPLVGVKPYNVFMGSVADTGKAS